MKISKKIKAIGLVTLLAGTIGLAGCAVQYDGQPIKSPEDVQNLISAAEVLAKQAGIQAGIDSVDITKDNVGVITEATEALQAEKTAQEARDAQIIADYEAEIVRLQEEVSEHQLTEAIEAVEVAEEVAISDGYEYDGLSLGGYVVVEDSILKDNRFWKLLDTETKFDGDLYDIEEIVTLKQNGAEILVSGFNGEKEMEYNPYLAIYGDHITNTIIECDGDYWHNLPNRKERDKKQVKWLKQNDYIVYRFWEKDILKSPEQCIKSIVEVD